MKHCIILLCLQPVLALRLSVKKEAEKEDHDLRFKIKQPGNLGCTKNGPDVSFVLATRNDGYTVERKDETDDEYASRVRQHHRHILDYLSSFPWASYNKKIEIVVVLYNMIEPGEPGYIDMKISDSSQRRIETQVPVRYIIVPRSVHNQQIDSQYPMLEYIAKNIGLRRAHGKVLITINDDTLPMPNLLHLLATDEPHGMDMWCMSWNRDVSSEEWLASRSEMMSPPQTCERRGLYDGWSIDNIGDMQAATCEAWYKAHGFLESGGNLGKDSEIACRMKMLGGQLSTFGGSCNIVVKFHSKSEHHDSLPRLNPPELCRMELNGELDSVDSEGARAVGISSADEWGWSGSEPLEKSSLLEMKLRQRQMSWGFADNVFDEIETYF